MKQLKDKEGDLYTGEVKGGLFAVWDKDKKNVGNFADEAAAVKLGGFEIVGEVKAEPPEGITNDSSAKVESGKAAAASPEQPVDPKKDNKTGAPAASQQPTGQPVDPKKDNKTDAAPAASPGAGEEAKSNAGESDAPESAKTEPTTKPA